MGILNNANYDICKNIVLHFFPVLLLASVMSGKYVNQEKRVESKIFSLLLLEKNTDKINVAGTRVTGKYSLLRPFTSSLADTEARQVREIILQFNPKKIDLTADKLKLATNNFLEFKFESRSITILADRFVIDSDGAVHEMTKLGLLEEIREMIKPSGEH